MKYKLFTILFLLIIGVFVFTLQAQAAVTCGTDCTLGLDGDEDYSTWAGFWDDLANLTGNITLTVDASAFTEDVAPATLTESLGGYTLHVLPASFPTTTDASTGAMFTCNYTGDILYIGLEGAGTVIIEGMVFIEGTSEPAKGFFIYTVITAYSLIIRRNIIKGCDLPFYYYDNTVQDFQVYNNIFFDASDKAINILVDAPSAVIANNTIVHAGGYGVYAGDEEVTFKNNLNYGAVTSCWTEIELLTNGYNNATSDATGEDADWGGTGSNNLSSIADPFNDIDNDDFTITAAGVIGGAGLDLSDDFTTDFFGVTRINWTIGAVEYVGAVNSAPTISSVTDYPDPEEAGNNVTFSVDWDDEGDEVKIHICKTDTLSSYACETNQVWCETDTPSADDPETCTYTTQSGDIGSNTYYAFVCDDEDECSNYTSSTFTVEAVSTPSIKFPGGVHFKGGTIFK